MMAVRVRGLQPEMDVLRSLVSVPRVSLTFDVESEVLSITHPYKRWDRKTLIRMYKYVINGSQTVELRILAVYFNPFHGKSRIETQIH